jgi:uncharacterized protein (DUF488 family)
MEIWTIGHSSHDIDKFIAMLKANGIRLLVDVRKVPGSKLHPHFNKSALQFYLNQVVISYEHLSGLGGRRKTKPDSMNNNWRNESFRGYADYMETLSFKLSVKNLLALAKTPTAIMCSEAVWWKCHRSLIADFLKASGHKVTHIMPAKVEIHPYTSAAQIVEGKLCYGSLNNLFP